ncbi:hypothetical protein OS493_005195 [Desmophyllum pertusum]|uniref:Uncharacterized protein n=1 Tax=Desmophyllum pertusum TaxID=174260 RepID=A0A9W9Z4D6_9CNID|nr:hypothetical protein OS493_005195 [Desmophyllum pertusum]
MQHSFIPAKRKHQHELTFSAESGGNGIPTGVWVTGRSGQSKATTFVLKHCPRQIGSRYRLVTTIHWKHNQSYTLAVKSNQLTIEVRPGWESFECLLFNKLYSKYSRTCI